MRKQSSSGAFTLVELLAVVAVLAIVAMLMVPALARTKVRSQLAGCLNNQKQLAMAWQMFANDNNDLITGMGDGGPNASPPAWCWRPGTQSGQTNWTGDPNVTHVANAGEAARVLDEWGYTRSAISRYAPAAKIIHCPGDWRWRDSVPFFAYRSYAGAGGLNDYIRAINLRHPAGTFLWIEENDIRTVSASIGKTQYSFGEDFGTWSLIAAVPDPPSFAQVLSSGWRDAPAAFHENACTFSWADGHVSARTWVSTYTIAFANNPAAGRAGSFPKEGRWQEDLLFVANAYAFSNSPSSSWP
jgi:prepilin-type N-terminal cleavage/methylation domain-containing protein/prepilin-type processing-associated H-X9-DG protein